VVAVDGEAPKRVVIYQYPSVDAVHAWRNDPAYEEVRKIGEKYAKYRTFAVEGIPHMTEAGDIVRPRTDARSDPLGP